MSVLKPTAIERAFALADSGFSITEIRAALSHEGYDRAHLDSKTLLRQLTERAKKAKGG
jgi:DNA-binding transcriptional MerR regulator